MKFLAACLTSLLVATGLPVWAQSNPVVVELFTSQGCSSCPPADALLQELTTRDDVIPLALHVDYWDYIGWKDEYADPAHTARQRAYARYGGRKMIYTPQMIVNGQQDVVGARALELAELIALHRAAAQNVSVQVERRGDMLTIRAPQPAEPVGGALIVQLVRYTPLRKAHITRGENAGLELDYVNIVDGWTVLGQWDGTGPFAMQVELDGDRPAVVLIQREGPGAIVAAARVR